MTVITKSNNSYVLECQNNHCFFFFSPCFIFLKENYTSNSASQYYQFTVSFCSSVLPFGLWLRVGFDFEWDLLKLNLASKWQLGNDFLSLKKWYKLGNREKLTKESKLELVQQKHWQLGRIRDIDSAVMQDCFINVLIYVYIYIYIYM